MRMRTSFGPVLRKGRREKGGAQGVRWELLSREAPHAQKKCTPEQSTGIREAQWTSPWLRVPFQANTNYLVCSTGIIVSVPYLQSILKVAAKKANNQVETAWIHSVMITTEYI